MGRCDEQKYFLELSRERKLSRIVWDHRSWLSWYSFSSFWTWWISRLHYIQDNCPKLMRISWVDFQAQKSGQTPLDHHYPLSIVARLHYSFNSFPSITSHFNILSLNEIRAVVNFTGFGHGCVYVRVFFKISNGCR